MKAAVVIELDEDERQQVARLLPSLALAFPEQAAGESDDARSWKLLRRLLYSDSRFDDEMLVVLRHTLIIARDRLIELCQPAHWSELEEVVVPGSAAPSEVVIEAATLALRNAAELYELVDQMADRAGLTVIRS